MSNLKLLAALVLAASTSAALAAGPYRATEFKPPAGGRAARIQAIDANGVMFGHYSTKQIQDLKFFRDRNGSYRTLDGYHEVARSATMIGTNVRGDLVGFRQGPKWTYSGLIADNKGGLIEVTHPTSTNVVLKAINASGTSAGHYGKGDDYVAFIRDPAGTLTDIKIPGGEMVFAGGIQDDGTVVGSYRTAPRTPRLFLRRPNGEIVTFDPPEGAQDITINGVNAAGQIAGSFSGENAKPRGFVRDPDGTYTLVKAPHGPESVVTAIGPKGEIAGTYTGPDLYGRAFVANAPGSGR